MKTCVLVGCGKKEVARRFCDMHYRRWRLYGDPHKVKRPTGKMDFWERFWLRVDKSAQTGCWNWNRKCRHGNRLGEKHNLAKLTWADIDSIRSSSESGPALGRRFNVSSTTIYRVRNGETWVKGHPTA